MVSKKEVSVIPDYGDVTDPKVRAKYGYLEGFVSIIGNSILFILKLLLGIFINSIALIADAVHSLSDSGTSAVVILGFRMAKKPPDQEHPYGLGRVEYIATLVIAILLFLVGVGFIQQSFERIFDLTEYSNIDSALLIGIIIIISAMIKEILAQFSFHIGKKIKSDVLIGDAWHHRSDAISSMAVGIGIICSSYGYPILDPIFGIIVSIIIIYIGFDLVKKSSNILIGTAPDEEIILEIKKIVKNIKDVKKVDNIFVHDYGITKIVSLQVEVENDLKLEEAHKIADNIENDINKKMKFSTIIHLEPKETHIDQKVSANIIESILEKQKQIITFHKIQIIRHGKTETIRMHVIVDKDMSIGASHEFCHELETIIQNQYGPCSVDIHLEPCGKDCEICSFSCKNRKEI